jgi:hypothetical protein
MADDSDEWLVAVEHNDVRRMTLDQLDAAYRVELVSDATLVRNGAMSTWNTLGAVLAKGAAHSNAASFPANPGKEDGTKIEVRLPDGTWLAGLDAADVETGVRDGWLGLSDDACVQGSGEYRPLHEAASDVFFVAVHHDPKLAHARRTARGFAVGAAIVVGAGGFVTGCMASFGIGLPAAVAALVVTVGAFYLLGKSGNFVVTGFVLVAAGWLLTLLTDMKFTVWSVLGFVLGAALGMVVSGGIGAAIGYGFGYLLGYVIGARTRLEPLPERVPPPRAILVLHLAGPTQDRPVASEHQNLPETLTLAEAGVTLTVGERRSQTRSPMPVAPAAPATPSAAVVAQSQSRVMSR